MSDDVKARLAAVRCDAAPHGWSDRTRSGCPILCWFPDGYGDSSVGIVEFDKGLLAAINWKSDGQDGESDGYRNWDLVPLPSPVAEQDEQPQPEWHTSDAKLVDFSTNGKPFEQVLARELIAARKRIAELEDERDRLHKQNSSLLDLCSGLKLERNELRNRLECPPVQKLATSGPSITRPVPAVDAWVTYGRPMGAIRWRVSGIETADGHTRIICGPVSLNASDDLLTGPSDRGPWRPIGEVR